MSRFTKTRKYRKSIGKRCMHCNKSATTTASWKTGNGFKVNVHYCSDHTAEYIEEEHHAQTTYLPEGPSSGPDSDAQGPS